MRLSCVVFLLKCWRNHEWTYTIDSLSLVWTRTLYRQFKCHKLKKKAIKSFLNPKIDFQEYYKNKKCTPITLCHLDKLLSFRNWITWHWTHALRQKPILQPTLIRLCQNENTREEWKNSKRINKYVTYIRQT